MVTVVLGPFPVLLSLVCQQVGATGSAPNRVARHRCDGGQLHADRGTDVHRSGAPGANVFEREQLQAHRVGSGRL